MSPVTLRINLLFPVNDSQPLLIKTATPAGQSPHLSKGRVESWVGPWGLVGLSSVPEEDTKEGHRHQVVHSETGCVTFSTSPPLMALCPLSGGGEGWMTWLLRLH